MLKTFLKDESGASLVEYGILVGLIAIVAIAAVSTVGTNVNAIFEEVATELGNVTADPAP